MPENEKITEEQDYEIVATVQQPGILTTNLKEVIEQVGLGMEKYTDVVVSDENMEDVSKMLTKLRKAKDALKKAWSDAKKEFNKPIELQEEDYKQLLAIVENGITKLKTDYDTIDSTQKATRFDERANVMDKALQERLEPDEYAFYSKKCVLWAHDQRWVNKTFSEKELNTEIDNVEKQIKAAWATLSGTYRAQMLEKFAEKGSLADAMQEGKRLEEQAEAYAEAERIRLAREAEQKEKAGIHAEVAPSKVHVAAEPQPTPAPVMHFDAPNESGHENDAICKGTFIIRGKRFKIEWLIKVAEAVGVQISKMPASN